MGKRALESERRVSAIYRYLRRFDGRACPTNKEIAEVLGMEKKQVAIDICRLEDLKRVRISRNGPIYRKIEWHDGATEWTSIQQNHSNRKPSKKLRKSRTDCLNYLKKFTGKPCPTNLEIAKRMDCSVATVVSYLSGLQSQGRIEIERIHMNARVIHFNNGTSTLPTEFPQKRKRYRKRNVMTFVDSSYAKQSTLNMAAE